MNVLFRSCCVISELFLYYLKFFTPLNASNIVIEMNESGRPSGEADVDFATHQDALAAMNKNRATLGI